MRRGICTVERQQHDAITFKRRQRAGYLQADFGKTEGGGEGGATTHSLYIPRTYAKFQGTYSVFLTIR